MSAVHVFTLSMHTYATEIRTDRQTIIFIQIYIFLLWTCPKYHGNGYPWVIGTWVPGYKISTHSSPTSSQKHVLPSTFEIWLWSLNPIQPSESFSNAFISIILKSIDQPVK